MAWLPISLIAEEQRIVQSERDSHPTRCVRRRLLVLWSLHYGLKREQAARMAGVAVSSVQRDIALYREGGLDAVLKSGRDYHPTSELAQYETIIRQLLEQQPVRTIAEACQRIKELTSVKRGPTHVI